MMPFERRGGGREPADALDPLLSARPRSRAAGRRSRAVWLVVPIVALVAAFGVQALRPEPVALLQLAFAASFALGVGWLVYALAGPRRERVVCPDCESPALENVDGGLCCRECGWRARATQIEDEFDADSLAERLRRRGTLGDPPRRW